MALVVALALIAMPPVQATWNPGWDPEWGCKSGQKPIDTDHSFAFATLYQSLEATWDLFSNMGQY